MCLPFLAAGVWTGTSELISHKPLNLFWEVTISVVLTTGDVHTSDQLSPATNLLMGISQLSRI